jgi:hypothetical protein
MSLAKLGCTPAVNSQWQGQGAFKYQLSRAIVDLEAYKNIVNGLSPDGKHS